MYENFACVASDKHLSWDVDCKPEVDYDPRSLRPVYALEKWKTEESRYRRVLASAAARQRAVWLANGEGLLYDERGLQED